MNFADLLAAETRLLILSALGEDSGYSHNELILQSILDAFGQRVSRDRLRTELHWLAEQGLVTLKDVSGVLVATLTRRGEDAAVGRVTVPGVRRPRPEA